MEQKQTISKNKDHILHFTPDTKTTIELVTALQKGESNAADAIFEAFHNDVYFFILKSVKDPELASHLTQDTFSEINEKIGSLSVPSAFLPWCKRIAHKRYTAHIKKRQSLLLDDTNTDYALMTSYNELEFEFFPGENVDSDDLRQTICDMLDILPEELRAALVMRYYDELSIKEIAKIQKDSEETITERLNDGRSAIERSIEAFEKKHNIKLDNTGIIPIILWFFREDRLKNGISLTEMTPAAKDALANLLGNAPKIIFKKIAIRIVAALMVTIATGLFVHLSQKEPVSPLPYASEITGNQVANGEKDTSREDLDTEPCNSETDTIGKPTENTEAEYTEELSNSENKSDNENRPADDSVTNDSENDLPDMENVPTEDNKQTNDSETENTDTPTEDSSDETIKAPPSKGLEYTLSDDGTYYILSSSENCTGNNFITIADEIDGIPVTVIGEDAFYMRQDIIGVDLPDHLLTIEKCAFFTCGLKTIDIPDSVIMIGELAFYNCCLDSISLSKNLLSIGMGAFGLNYFRNFTVPQSVKALGTDILMDCDNLISLNVEKGNAVYHSSGNCIIETQSKSLVLGCSTSVIPTDGSVTNIEKGAFYGCPIRKHFIVPEGVRSLGYQAFDGCEITSISLPSTLTLIDYRLFHSCFYLTDIHYSGTMEQWKNIEKKSEWFPKHGNYTIHCTDGNISA